MGFDQRELSPGRLTTSALDGVEQTSSQGIGKQSGVDALQALETQREDGPVGGGAGSVVWSIVLWPEGKPFKLGPFPVTSKAELEFVHQANGGIGRDGKSTPPVGLFSNQAKTEYKFDGKVRAWGQSLKTAFASFRLESLNLDVKVFETSMNTDDLVRRATSKKARQTLIPFETDLVKASHFAPLSEMDLPEPAKSYVREAKAAGYDVRLKVELSIKVKDLLSSVELDDLQKFRTKALQLTDKLKQWADVTDKVLDESEDILKRSKQALKGPPSKDLFKRGLKEGLRDLTKEMDDLAAKTAKNSKLYRKLTKELMERAAGKVLKRVAIRTLTVASRLIPVVGWLMFAYDVLELGYLAYKIYDGTAKFLGGGGELSMWDAFGSSPTPTPQADGEGGQPTGATEGTPRGSDRRSTEGTQLDTGSPAGRLIKGVTRKMEGTQFPPEQLERLLWIAEQGRLTDEKVDAILAKIGDLPSVDAARVLDWLERQLGLAPQDRDRDGILDDVDPDGGRGDGANGNGNRDGKGDGKGKGKGNGIGNGNGRGNRDRNANRDRGAGSGKKTKTSSLDRDGDGQPEFEDYSQDKLERLISDPIAAGLIVVLDEGKLATPVATREGIATPMGRIRAWNPRWRGARGPREAASDGTKTFEIFTHYSIERGDPNALKITALFSYQYAFDPRSKRIEQMTRAQDSFTTTTKRLIAAGETIGETEYFRYQIVKVKPAAKGWSVTFTVLSVKQKLFFEGPDGWTAYEAGQTYTEGVSK